jgi:hypothetical protein
MEFWYFKFEGEFLPESSDYGKGCFSGCIVPDCLHSSAKKAFLRAVRTNHVVIIDIIEEFSVDAYLLDKKDSSNKFWIDFYKKAEKVGKPIFDVWHTYPLGS